ncbi:hypothetical protein EV643_101208 [Kribbella sp. VKM Ac-2527]|uniref:Uncharacterized protein n=1 Tax=Kribbella caucasensis TaxID=2512215 RepID=A0A4R6KQ03_9ACTN|nr:hypothetical protein [Kribbella sp. VKM Ac-2527]TDO54419.1 hypothetical protein EV643_101208 [Kribbella sp. VKM Ac-2527]
MADESSSIDPDVLRALDEEREITPFTIAEQYHRGELTRDEVIQQLIDYDYLPQDRIPDDMSVDIAMYIEGSWDDMERALRHELIDAEIYQLVLDALRERESWPPPTAGS